jgi:spectinomycin phosphotransferase
MLEKPNIPDQELTQCLDSDFGLVINEVTFLPLGGDLTTAVYRTVVADGTPYFCKLRRGEFDETTVELAKFLHDRGIAQIIAPLETQTGQLRAELGAFKVIVYPYIEGKNGYEAPLSEKQWKEFGEALGRIHSVALPPTLEQGIVREEYAPYWRERTTKLVERVRKETLADLTAAEGAEFLRARGKQVLELVGRAEELAREVETRNPKFVLCHGDLHAGNLHVTEGGAIYIVDWDDPSLAPRERDLMFIGGGQG